MLTLANARSTEPMSTPLDRANDRALGGNSNLPAGVSDRTIDEHFGGDEGESCEKCSGDGNVICPDCMSAHCAECDETGKIVCPECEGTGVTYPPTAEEIAIDKADRDRDAAKDREAEERQ